MIFDIFGVVLHIWFHIDIAICQKSGTHYQTVNTKTQLTTKKHEELYLRGVGGVRSSVVSFPTEVRFVTAVTAGSSVLFWPAV